MKAKTLVFLALLVLLVPALPVAAKTDQSNHAEIVSLTKQIKELQARLHVLKARSVRQNRCLARDKEYAGEISRIQGEREKVWSNEGSAPPPKLEPTLQKMTRNIEALKGEREASRQKCAIK